MRKRSAVLSNSLGNKPPRKALFACSPTARRAAKSVRKALLRKVQAADKVEVQEAVPPAGVLGAEPLSRMPQRLPHEPAKRCFRAMAANQGGNTLSLAAHGNRNRRTRRRFRNDNRRAAPSDASQGFFDDLRFWRSRTPARLARPDDTTTVREAATPLTTFQRGSLTG